MTDSRGLNLIIVMLLYFFGLRTISAVIIADNIIVLRDGSEQVAERKVSPMLVARMIKAKAIKWNFECIRIITESLFENIAREWFKVFSRSKFCDVSVKVLKSQTADEDFSFPKSDFRDMTIFLLTPKLLADVLSKKRVRKLLQDKMGTGQCRITIVGRCLPSFIRRYKVMENLRIMIYPVRTENWINGIEMTGKTLTIHSIHRQSKKTWKALPFISTHSDKVLETRRNNKRSLFGILQTIFIYADIFPVQNIVDAQDGKLTGIFGKITTYIVDYLQISIHFKNHATNDEFDNTRRILTRNEDLHIGIFPIRHELVHAYLPPLYYDVLTLYGAKIYRPFSFDILFSILKQDVWITLILVIVTCNLCYYLAHVNSPSLRYHPRIKNNSFGKYWRILFLDSLIRFQMEWQQGPNLSTRWLNTTLSFLSFMSACYYLPLFTGKLLSDRNFFPYTDKFNYCNPYHMQNVFLSRDLVTFQIYYNCLNVRNVRCIDRSYDYGITSDALLEKTKHGEVYLIAGGTYAKEKFQHFRNISYLQKAVCRKPVSIGCLHDFIFMDMFSILILQIREAGLLQALRERYTTTYPADIPILRAITFSETWFTFVILGIGLSVAIFIVVVEFIAKQ